MHQLFSLMHFWAYGLDKHTGIFGSNLQPGQKGYKLQKWVPCKSHAQYYKDLIAKSLATSRFWKTKFSLNYVLIQVAPTVLFQYLWIWSIFLKPGDLVSAQSIVMVLLMSEPVKCCCIWLLQVKFFTSLQGDTALFRRTPCRWKIFPCIKYSVRVKVKRLLSHRITQSMT